jgi:hypothetical protein
MRGSLSPNTSGLRFCRLHLALASFHAARHTCGMSAAQLAQAVRALPPTEHRAFLDSLLVFDADAIRERLEDLDDLRDARAVLKEETEWTPWEQVKEELHGVAG